MVKLFYTLLYRGLLTCGGVVSAIIATVLWRRIWVGGKSFAELGIEGNGVIFMGVLVLLCFVIAWRIKRAQKNMSTEID